MSLFRALLAFAVLSLVAFQAPAKADARIALVIGNAAYGGDIGRLSNPANDARLVADALKRLGFDVIIVTDANLDQMNGALRKFGRALTKAGAHPTGVFYYAGHGLQVAGENYLIPIGAEIQHEGDVVLEAVPASTVLQEMQFAEGGINVVILDACRNNPLARSMRSSLRGLAEIRDRPTGSFIAYSTAPGQTASDGDGKDGPYAVALAETIATPGLGIEETFRTIRGKVVAATKGEQVPWDASSLTEPFFFAGEVKSDAGAQGGNQTEMVFWNTIKDSRDPADFKAYLQQFPQGSFASLARNRLATLKTGETVTNDAQDAAPATPAVAAVAPPADPPPAAPPADTDAALKTCENNDVKPEDRVAVCRSLINAKDLTTNQQSDVLNSLGNAYYKLDKLDDAVKQYEGASRLDPSWAWPVVNIGRVQSDRSQYVEARQTLERGLKLDPDNPDGVQYHAYVTAMLGNFEAARREADRAVALSDANAWARVDRAWYKAVTGDLDGAVADADQARKADTSDWYSDWITAIYYMAGRTADANTMADAAIRKHGNCPCESVIKAMVLRAEGKSGEAQALLKSAEQQFTKNIWYKPIMDWMLGKSSQQALIASADGTSDRPARLTHIYFHLGEAAYQGGRRDEAKRLFEQTVALNAFDEPPYGMARARLAQLGAQ